MPDLFVAPSKQPENKSGKPLPFFAAYSQHPQGILFANQEEAEHIVLFLRKHMIKNLTWITTTLMLAAVPALLLLLQTLLPQFLPSLPISYTFILVAFYYLLIAGYALLQFISWFYNVGIVTDKRIIDIDFKDIMYREVATTRIGDIIDVEFHQGGFLHSFVDFGNVFIQTEGIKPNFEFLSIPHPDEVANTILDLKEKTNQQHE